MTNQQPETFGRRLRRLRTEAGLTGQQLAAEAGLGQATVSLLEADKREPGLSTFAALCRALGVPWSTFEGVVGE